MYILFAMDIAKIQQSSKHRACTARRGSRHCWDRESRVQFFRRCLISEFTGKRNTQEKNVSNNRKNLLYYL